MNGQNLYIKQVLPNIVSGETLSDVISVNDSCFIVLCEINENNTNERMDKKIYVFKTDFKGKIYWDIKIKNKYMMQAQQLVKLHDSSFLVTYQRTFYNYNTKYDERKFFIRKYDFNGELHWNKEFYDPNVSWYTSINVFEDTLNSINFIYPVEDDKRRCSFNMIRINSEGKTIFDKEIVEEHNFSSYLTTCHNKFQNKIFLFCRNYTGKINNKLKESKYDIKYEYGTREFYDYYFVFDSEGKKLEDGVFDINGFFSIGSCNKENVIVLSQEIIDDTNTYVSEKNRILQFKGYLDVYALYYNVYDDSLNPINEIILSERTHYDNIYFEQIHKAGQYYYLALTFNNERMPTIVKLNQNKIIKTYKLDQKIHNFSHAKVLSINSKLVLFCEVDDYPEYLHKRLFLITNVPLD